MTSYVPTPPPVTPLPLPVPTPTETAITALANTGADGMIIGWGVLGALALIALGSWVWTNSRGQ